MRKASTSVTFKRFLGWAIWYEELIDRVHEAKRVIRTREEKSEFFAALFLRMYTLWEGFAEELLVDCLNHDTAQYARYVGLKLPRHATRTQCKAMLFGLGFLDLKGGSGLKLLARRVLVPAHNPFSSIPPRIEKKLDDMHILRNHLAHGSLASRRSFRAMCRNRYGLSRTPDPSAFLLARDSVSNAPRLKMYVGTLAEATTFIGKFLGYSP